MSSMWTSMGRRKIRLIVILKDFPSLQRSCFVFNLQLDQYLVGLSGCNECVVRMGSLRLSFYHTCHNFCFFCQKCGVGDEYVSTNNPRICFAWFWFRDIFPPEYFKGIIPCWECFVGEFVQEIFKEFWRNFLRPTIIMTLSHLSFSLVTWSFSSSKFLWCLIGGPFLKASQFQGVRFVFWRLPQKEYY